jgi:hypothetical protein
MRAALTTWVCCLFPVWAGAQVAVTAERLATLTSLERSAALLGLREAPNASAALHDLEISARQRVEARRERGLPPHSTGCLTADEFDLDTQINLARKSTDGEEFDETIRRYRGSVARLDTKLATARRTNAWARQFSSLRRGERQWRAAQQPRVRELLLRTLNGQAIRAALLHDRGARAATKGARLQRHAGPAVLAATAYREYVFNLMCANDEENLRWFKRQVAEIGWFGQKEYGWAADRAALLMVQHADPDPGFQETVVAALWPRLASADTDPENFAYLVDRVAVRAGRPQRFGTQMECVEGTWIAPEIEDQATLDERRERMNLVAYDVQLARMRGLCRD